MVELGSLTKHNVETVTKEGQIHIIPTHLPFGERGSALSKQKQLITCSPAEFQ